MPRLTTIISCELIGNACMFLEYMCTCMHVCMGVGQCVEKGAHYEHVHNILYVVFAIHVCTVHIAE